MMNIRNVAYGKQSVQFNFSGCKKYNKVQISINGDDLYDLIFVTDPQPDQGRLHRDISCHLPLTNWPSSLPSK